MMSERHCADVVHRFCLLLVQTDVNEKFRRLKGAVCFLFDHVVDHNIDR
jgi:hypothetical protein